ncbi:MAG: M28 family peptidase [Alphaproteobacteria bacterium]|nr:M28 family peptidase [Alphaproteobacteria bacterium]
MLGRESWWAAGRPLAVFSALFLAFLLRAAPLGLDPVRATPRHGEFDTARAIERLSRILGDGAPHPVDSDALDLMRERLLREIQALGYEARLDDATACRALNSGAAMRCARVRNIAFDAGPGPSMVAGRPKPPTLVLTAHYDSVDASPGAADDGIGIAVWLEVAHLLKQTPPSRPVLFLFTDGEETALLGAQLFSDQPRHGELIGTFINLEARGVRGPAMMFETSHPNSGVVTDWSKGAVRPLANSLMSAVYGLMPNATDLTVYLRQGWRGVNIAISDGLAFYHTERDSLAMLDPRSVQHMGDQALGAARAFIASDRAASDGDEGEIVYADIGSRLFVTLPATIALLLLGLAFGVSALLVMRPARASDWRRPDWRAFALPPALIAGSAALAFAAQSLIALLRPEPAFWTAHSLALNSLIFLLTLLASALCLAFLAPASRREALFASGWFWFLVIGMGLSLAVPGMAIIFLMPGVVFVLAAAIARLDPRAATAAHAVAGAFLLLIFLPLIHLVDVMMGLVLAALFGVLEAIALAPLLAVIGPLQASRRTVLAAIGAACLAAFATAILVPAYSRDQPLALNLLAHFDMDARAATLTASAPPGALPKSLRDQFDVSSTVLPGVTARLASRELIFAERPSASFVVETDTVTNKNRTLTLRLDAPGARQVRLRIPAGARPLSVQHQDALSPTDIDAPPDGDYVFDCVGRACSGARIAVTLAPPSVAPGPWTVQGYYAGLPQEAAAVAALRPETSLRIGMGDVTVTTRRLIP